MLRRPIVNNNDLHFPLSHASGDKFALIGKWGYIKEKMDTIHPLNEDWLNYVDCAHMVFSSRAGVDLAPQRD